jgi:1-phosphofructokinase
MAAPTIVTVTFNPAVDRVLEAPQFHLGKHVSAKRVAMYPAGKGVIVSRVLAQLGVRSIATGFVGRGELAMFEEFLERVGSGATVCQFLVVRARTRDNITIVDPVDETETHLRDQGFQVQPEDVERIRSKVGLLARRDTIMCFCGSLPPGLDPNVQAAIVERCREQGARVVVDASGDALKALRGARLWMTKINESELRTLTGAPVETEEEVLHAARALSVVGGGSVQHVVVTRGPDGALLVGPEQAIRARVSVHPGRILSTVGSGDSLLAGLLSEWTRTGDWSGALKKGVAVATANAVNREAGLVLADDIAEFESTAAVEMVE